mmetsp:Transcript_3149/g.11309  ORF Transcript_3149/g.11309 Transcript_3149/m.11309 type:complete len:211 (-) Transcript_3149:2710-3342(-)
MVYPAVATEPHETLARESRLLRGAHDSARFATKSKQSKHAHVVVLRGLQRGTRSFNGAALLDLHAVAHVDAQRGCFRDERPLQRLRVRLAGDHDRGQRAPVKLAHDIRNSSRLVCVTGNDAGKQRIVGRAGQRVAARRRRQNSNVARHRCLEQAQALAAGQRNYAGEHVALTSRVRISAFAQPVERRGSAACCVGDVDDVDRKLQICDAR